MRTVSIIALIFSLSCAKPKLARYSDDIYFYDAGAKGLYDVLSERLKMANVPIDEELIQSICVEDTVMGNPLYAGLFIKDSGEIILSRDIMDEPLLAYWVLAHEVLHSQGVYDHDPESLLMCPSAYGYWYAVVFGHSIDSIVEVEYKRYLK